MLKNPNWFSWQEKKETFILICCLFLGLFKILQCYYILESEFFISLIRVV